MTKVRSKQVDVTVAGTTGSADSGVIDGRLLAVHLDYSASMAATADVTIARKADGDTPAETLLTVSNNATDGWYRPRAALVDNTGGTIAGVYDAYGVNGEITVSVAQGTDGETVTATIVYEAM